jgi:hypothetical protein
MGFAGYFAERLSLFIACAAVLICEPQGFGLRQIAAGRTAMGRMNEARHSRLDPANTRQVGY